MTDLASLCADLQAESTDLDGIVAGLDPSGWETPTPAPGWAVRDQVGHLAGTDRAALQAVTDPAAFVAGLVDIAVDIDGFLQGQLDAARELDPAELLTWWRDGRAALVDALLAADPTARVPWYGPPMSPLSFATARLMETWAHGQDVVDALGVRRQPTTRLRHIAHLGVRTRGFAYALRGRPMPDADVRVELVGPDGEAWEWGDPVATDRITGPALDFALLVTQRRHPDDVSLVAVGDAATEWLALAQCFAGPPGNGRTAGQFA